MLNQKEEGGSSSRRDNKPTERGEQSINLISL